MRLGWLNVHYDPRKVIEVNWMVLRDLDVLSLQEFESLRGDTAWEGEQRVCREAGGWGFSYGEWERKGYPNKNVSHGIATFSRYPIVEKLLLHLPPFIYSQFNFEKRRRMAISSLIDVHGSKIQVVNLHLDNQLKFHEKMAQFEPVLNMAKSDCKSAIGGDLNSAPCEWAGEHLRIPYPSQYKPFPAIKQVMKDHGYETIFEHVKTHKWLPFQLDGVFTKGIRVIKHGTLPIKGTDHRLLWIEC